MLHDLSLYVSALLDHALQVVTGGIPIVLDQFMRLASDRWKTWSDAHTPSRRRFELGVLLLAVTWAGFSAWKTEHSLAETYQGSINGDRGYVAKLSAANALATSLQARIDGAGGYRDEIASLEGRTPPSQLVIEKQRLVSFPSANVLTKDRSKYVTSLQSFLTEANILFRSIDDPSANDDKISTIMTQAGIWKVATAEKINRLMGINAQEHFLEIPDKADFNFQLPPGHATDMQAKVNGSLNSLNHFKTNLKEMIDSSQWDPK